MSNQINHDGHAHLPPLDIIEKGWSDQTGENRAFAIITTWVMEEKQPAIHPGIWYGNDIGHPSHAQTNNNKKQARQIMKI